MIKTRKNEKMKFIDFFEYVSLKVGIYSWLVITLLMITSIVSSLIPARTARQFSNFISEYLIIEVISFILTVIYFIIRKRKYERKKQIESKGEVI